MSRLELRYFRGRTNFGDALNPWLWRRLLPEVNCESQLFDDTVLVGIGTLLNERFELPRARRIIVFSTGVGYGQSTPRLDSRWCFYCVRGPLSAAALALSPNLSICDGGVLVSRFYTPSVNKCYEFGYMPHMAHIECGRCAWRRICSDLGIALIDPLAPVDVVLDRISEVKVLITEAMHGAIVADALRIPWIAVSTDQGILSLKWEDWSSSLGLKYSPTGIVKQIDYDRSLGLEGQVKGLIRFHVGRTQLWRLMRTKEPQLSKDSVIRHRVEELEYKLDDLRRDII